jgi:hypothetical protein
MKRTVDEQGRPLMTAHALPRHNVSRKPRNLMMLPVACIGLLIVAAGIFVALVLRPTWSGAPVPFNAPAIPVTIAGTIFDVPPAAIRKKVQRHTGPQDRIDLAFVWPSLAPPPADNTGSAEQVTDVTGSIAPPDTGARLFVTIAALGPVLPPLERIRGIYPRYVEAEATSGPDGLAILPFRKASPYVGEDLVYVAGTPEQFFARCTRQTADMPGTCIYERLVDADEITFRFPRAWLGDWRNVSAGFDRLIAQIHPQ